MSVGKRIKQLREVKGLTQQEFATAMKVHRSMVAKYEADHPMSIEALVNMCGILDTTPDYILGYRPTQKVNNGTHQENGFVESKLVKFLVQELEEKKAALKGCLAELAQCKKAH